MGRTTSAENKGKFITIRVKASFKNELLRVHEELFGNIVFQDFLATMLASGLEYEQILQEKKREWRKSFSVVKSQKELEEMGGAESHSAKADSIFLSNNQLQEMEKPSPLKISRRFKLNRK